MQPAICGSRGWTSHDVIRLLATSSLETVRLCLNDQTQKKLARLKGNLDVQVTDEVCCVPADLLRADALRTMNAWAALHKLKST